MATPPTPPTPEHVDFLVVGAGLSGIGAAHHFTTAFPDRSYVILESRDAIGGTWDLFRYPGIRSDSDMITLGYRFRPWTDTKTIADGEQILQYVRDTARDAGIDRHIRFGHRVLTADWSSAEGRWTVTAERVDTGETVVLTTDWLMGCSGYYRYDEGFTPDFPGRDDFTGQVVHPQHWPEDLDYAGKKVVVIGSGATAITLVPAMATGDGAAEHVTMLQRTPTFVVSLPQHDPLTSTVGKVLPSKVSYALARAKNVATHVGSYQFAQRQPKVTRKLIRSAMVRQLPEDFDVDLHFNPPYDPWDQRLCVVPNGDLFKALRHGRASIVTDHIDRFDATGILLKSGEHLEADIIVTATGLNLLALGGLEFSVDGEPRPLPSLMAYKGMMLSGLPNFAFIVGYTNASWTLKADLVCEYVVRLLKHLERTGTRVCVAERDPAMPEEPFLDFAAGYVLRAVDAFPKQGAKAPWRLKMNYYRDVVLLRHQSVTDDVVRFTNPVGTPASSTAGRRSA